MITFTSSICCIYASEFGQYWTSFCLGNSSVPNTPYMQFLFVRPRFCLQLPSDSTSRWTPLSLANSSYCQACSGLSPPNDSRMPSAPKKAGLRIVFFRLPPCFKGNCIMISQSFLTNRQRIAFSTARTITPTSAKMARYIFAMPNAPSTRQINLISSANTMF